MNKWQLILHTDDSGDSYYEITNGPISLVASCGYVGESEEEEDAIFKKVADTLNESGINFHSENKLEFDLYLENQILSSALEDIARQKTCVEQESDENTPIGSDGTRLGDINVGYDTIIEIARQAIKYVPK